MRCRRCLFLCRVVNTALCGVEYFVPSVGQRMKLERAIAASGRRAMGGRAHWEEEGGRVRSLTTKQ
eukprot:9438732-Pyramimonas_sp.AAC.1